MYHINIIPDQLQQQHKAYPLNEIRSKVKLTSFQPLHLACK